MDDDQAYALARLVQVFGEIGIRYTAVGSLASSTRGLPRLTRDFDLLADVRPQHIARLVAELQDEYYVDATAVADAVRSSGSFNIIHVASILKLDIFVVGSNPIRRTEVLRGLSEDVHGIPLNVASAEDVIVSKLHWYRTGGETSERQWQDVLEVLTVQGTTLDFDYMHDMARERGVTDLLDRALTESAP
jgi:hypothetical protein